MPPEVCALAAWQHLQHRPLALATQPSTPKLSDKPASLVALFWLRQLSLPYKLVVAVNSLLFWFPCLGEPVPDYKPPYEAELGASITSEHIREFVARQKQRPGFPDVWKNNHPVSFFAFSFN